MMPHPLPNFEIQKYLQSKPKFNDAFLGKKLLKIKHGTYAVSLGNCKSIEAHWIELHVACVYVNTP